MRGVPLVGRRQFHRPEQLIFGCAHGGVLLVKGHDDKTDILFGISQIC